MQCMTPLKLSADFKRLRVKRKETALTHLLIDSSLLTFVCLSKLSMIFVIFCRLSVASQNFPWLWHEEIHAALSAAVQAETLAVAVG